MLRKIYNTLMTIIACYVVACLLLVMLERTVLYQPFDGPTTPKDAKLEGYEQRVFPSKDGANIPYWEHEGEGPLLLYFHGNGGGLYMFTPALEFLAAKQFHVIAMEYRGYPGAPSKPTEKRLIEDAQTLYDTVKANHPDKKIVLWGYSLGSGVATQLAESRAADVVILEAPFSSAVDRAQQLFPIFPVKKLMRDQFRSSDVIRQVHAPLFIMHGDADIIIPITHGKTLFKAANEPKVFREYHAAGHLNLIKTPAYADAVDFINSVVHQTSPE